MNDLVVSNQLDKRVIASLFEQYTEDKIAIEKFAAFAKESKRVTKYFLSASETSSYLIKDIFELDPAVKALDSSYWSTAINQTDVLNCMTADKRNEWNEMIRKFKTPAFELDTVISTIQNLLLNRSTFMAEKVDGIFRNLSGEHVTNSPSAFRKRMIMCRIATPNNYSVTPSVNSENCNYIDDLRSVIDMIFGRDNDKYRNSYRDISRMYANGEIGKWQEFDGGAFKMRVYKKGTAHLEVHPNVAAKLNQMLSELYPSAIPPVHREVKKEKKEHSLYKEFLSRSLTGALDGLMPRLKRESDQVWTVSCYWVEDEGESELGRILEGIGAIKTDSEYRFNFDPNIVLSKIIRSGVLPEKKSHQYYPTPKEVVEMVQEIANVDSEQVLEPSAGQGALVEGLDPELVDCIEIDPTNCSILKSKGFKVECKDFLDQKVERFYNTILMNPPFSDGRAKDHVDHAIKFLADGGRILAIVPSNFDTGYLGDRFVQEFDIPAKAFKDSGTNISTKIIEIN